MLLFLEPEKHISQEVCLVLLVCDLNVSPAACISCNPKRYLTFSFLLTEQLIFSKEKLRDIMCDISAKFCKVSAADTACRCQHGG